MPTPKKTSPKTPVKKAKKSLKDDSAFVAGSDELLVTEDGLVKLKEELKYLEVQKRREIAERLQEAIAYGDLSENSEYQEAKEEQAFTEGRIAELKKKIKSARVITDTSGERINLGSKVVLKNITLGENEEYHIVGPTEVDPFQGKISNESLIGQAILGKKKGLTFTVEAPAGTFEYEIVKIA